MNVFIGTLMGAGVAIFFSWIILKMTGYSIVKTRVKATKVTSGGGSSVGRDKTPTKPRKLK